MNLHCSNSFLYKKKKKNSAEQTCGRIVGGYAMKGPVRGKTFQKRSDISASVGEKVAFCVISPTVSNLRIHQKKIADLRFADCLIILP